MFETGNPCKLNAHYQQFAKLSWKLTESGHYTAVKLVLGAVRRTEKERVLGARRG